MNDMSKISDKEMLLKGFKEKVLNNKDTTKNLKEDKINIDKQIKRLIDIFLSNKYDSNDEVESILKEINAYKHKINFPIDYLAQKFFTSETGQRENLMSYIDKYLLIKENVNNKTRFILNTIKESYEVYNGYINYTSNEITKLNNKVKDSYKEKFSEVNEKFNEFDNKLTDAESKINNQLISLIAIFTTLAFLLFGGISFLSDLLKAFESTEELKILFIVSVWGLAFSNIFYLFIYFIFCMIGKDSTKIKNLKCIQNKSNLILGVIAFICFSITYRIKIINFIKCIYEVFN